MIHRFVCAVLLLFSCVAFGETRYISDELRVPLRSSPCGRCQIIHKGLVSGAQLELVEQNEEGWSHVTTRDGLDGWLPSQYLVDQPVARHRLAQLEKRAEGLKQENSSLAAQVQALQATNAELESKLNQTLEKQEAVSSELSDIKQISSNAVSLHEQNQELLKRNRMLQSDIDLLTASNEQLEQKNAQRWFFYGALAVLIGSLLTVLIPRLKPRKRFSEWT